MGIREGRQQEGRVSFVQAANFIVAIMRLTCAGIAVAIGSFWWAVWFFLMVGLNGWVSNFWRWDWRR